VDDVDFPYIVDPTGTYENNIF
jgi:hypothetical protein